MDKKNQSCTLCVYLYMSNIEIIYNAISPVSLEEIVIWFCFILTNLVFQNRYLVKCVFLKKLLNMVKYFLMLCVPIPASSKKEKNTYSQQWRWCLLVKWKWPHIVNDTNNWCSAAQSNVMLDQTLSPQKLPCVQRMLSWRWGQMKRPKVAQFRPTLMHLLLMRLPFLLPA